MPIKLPTDHTADDPYGATWAWSSGNTVLTITGVTSWSGGAGTVVHATASADAFKSAATGLAVAEDTDIWKYTLASAGPVTSPEITTRFPPLNQGNVTPDASAIGYVDFDKEMDVASFSSHDAFYINESSGHHSAGDPSGTMSIYWSNSNTRLNITGVSGWSGGGGTTVEICSSGESSWHSLDGGILTPGTILWRYRLSQGSGPSGPTPEVVSQIPTLDATGVSSTAAWIITFNTSIDTSSFGSNIIKAGTSPLHTAGWPTGTVTPVWSSGNTVLTLNGWTGWDGGGDQVHLVASFEGIRSYGGRYLPENSTIVRYQIASIPTPITPEVSSRTPTLEATGVASNETLIITFSTSMDTASTQNSITARNGTHTAGSHSGYTSNWSNNNQTLTITNLLWSGGGLTVVNLISSGEGVRSYAGIPMAANTDLWKYTLASQGGGSGPTPEVSSRSPLLDATGVSGSATLSVTFSTTMDTNSSEQSITVHPTLHTAGNPIPSSPSPVWSNGNRTITFSNITGWTGPGKDVYVITNGEGVRSSLGRPMPAGSVLWRYTLQ